MLMINAHHAVMDGWSMGILIKDFTTTYNAYLEERTPELPPLSIQYRDIAAWQRKALNEKTLQNQLKYWKQTLNGSPSLLEIPTVRIILICMTSACNACLELLTNSYDCTI